MTPIPPTLLILYCGIFTQPEEEEENNKKPIFLGKAF
jgi:hypothetical protein